jgi:hypothetical protein
LCAVEVDHRLQPTGRSREGQGGAEAIEGRARRRDGGEDGRDLGRQLAERLHLVRERSSVGGRGGQRAVDEQLPHVLQWPGQGQVDG